MILRCAPIEQRNHVIHAERVRMRVRHIQVYGITAQPAAIPQVTHSRSDLCCTAAPWPAITALAAGQGHCPCRFRVLAALRAIMLRSPCVFPRFAIMAATFFVMPFLRSAR